MRAFRLTLVAALSLGSLAVVGLASSGPAGATVGTYTAATANIDPATAGSPVPGFAATAAQVSVSATTPSASIQFTITPPSDGTYVMTIAPPQTGAITLGGHNTDSMTAAFGSLVFSITHNGQLCAASGALDILQIDTDSSGKVIDFAADYSYRCNPSPAVGQLRWNSSVAYTDISVSPNGWNFGDQTVGANGTAKSFELSNAGVGSETIGQGALANNNRDFSVTSDSCSNHSLAVGASCTVTIVPHPTTPEAVNSSEPYDGNFDLPVTGPGDTNQIDVEILLGVNGVVSCCPLNATPLPGQITVTWGNPGAPYLQSATSYQILKGTSPNSLAAVSTAPTTQHSWVDPATPGTAYYYAIRSAFADGSTSTTPIVAAEDWPKYSDGVYHHLAAPVRFVQGLKVTAGHPVTLSILGQHGIPSSGVQAIAVDLQGTAPTETTSLFAYPAGTASSAGDLSVLKGTTGTNFAIVKLGSGGKITISASHGTPLVALDVQGYFATAALTTQGYGQTLQDFTDPFTLIDTRHFDGHPLAGLATEDAAVDFGNRSVVPHVTSLLVQILAYGATAGGYITAYQADAKSLPGTINLSYRPNVVTENTAIVPVGISSEFGPGFPAIKVLNRGSKPVQLYVSVIGFFDDNTLTYGARYVPQNPYHLLFKTMTANTSVITGPGSQANLWTTALMTKMADYNPTATSQINIAATKTTTTFGAVPLGGQMHALAKVTTMVSAVLPTGFVNNEMRVQNTAGTDTLSFWVFGRFDGYPQPTAPNFSVGDSAPQVAPALNHMQATRATVLAW